MVVAKELLSTISNVLSVIENFKIENHRFVKLEKACLDKLYDLGYTIPSADNAGCKWIGWGKNNFIYFDFLGFHDNSLVLGECKLYREKKIPHEKVRNFIDRISKVNPGGRKITALFVSNVPLCEKGYEILRSLDDVIVEPIIFAKRLKEE